MTERRRIPQLIGKRSFEFQGNGSSLAGFRGPRRGLSSVGIRVFFLRLSWERYGAGLVAGQSSASGGSMAQGGLGGSRRPDLRVLMETSVFRFSAKRCGDWVALLERKTKPGPHRDRLDAWASMRKRFSDGDIEKRPNRSSGVMGADQARFRRAGLAGARRSIHRPGISFRGVRPIENDQ